VFADFEKLDNVGMLQPRHRLGLGPEAQTLIAVGKVVAQQHLERHHSVKLGVPGTVDDAHAAPANLPEEDVAQEVFRVAAASIEKFRRERPGDSFRGWLRGITRNFTLL